MGTRLTASVVNQVIPPFIPLPGFKTEWQTTAPNETITLPTVSGGVFNATVDWGDGNTSTLTTYNDPDRIHTYTTPGTYQIEIKGECPSWSFNNGGDRLKLKKIINWGDSSAFGGFSSLSGGFYGCSNLTTLGTGKILAKASLVYLQQT